MFPMSEEECLRIIAIGWVDAEDLLVQAEPSLRTKFRAVDKKLVKFLEEVREYFPDAQYYTAGGGFTLMLGSSHNSKEKGQQELIALLGKASIGDGDF